MNPEALKQLENELWRSADALRANSDLKSSEYSTPVLGLIFLKFADNRYRRFEKEIVREYTRLKGTRREKYLSDIAIEEYKPELSDMLPGDEYSRLTRTDKMIPAQLLKHFSNIPSSAQKENKRSAVDRKTRDLLLPRLISGKLSVENLDIPFPPSMREMLETDRSKSDRAGAIPEDRP